jgi:flagellar protein FliT
MLSMPDQLDLYEEIRALSADMVNAARANDWERLVTLECSVAALRDELIANSGPGPDAGASATENDHKRGLIQQILEDDAEIRRHTEPWMEHVRQFLGSQNRRKQVQHAYAATDSAPGGF